MMSRFLIAFKFLRQLGLRPLALYGLYKFGLITGHYKRITSITPPIPITNYQLLFTLPSRDQLLSTLGEDGKTALLKEADEIVGGKIRMFGGEPVDLKLTFDQPLHHWIDYEIDHSLLSSFVFPHNDIKFIWEPARFGFAFILGRAYHLAQDQKYAEAFWKYFESFDESNPPYFGPHWMNGQEVAIRMMSLVWAEHVFETGSTSSEERRGQLIQSIYAHANRIPSTLIYARSQNNNHLVTESAALYTAGLMFKNQKWRALGWRWLHWSLQNQISGYGEYIQHSTNYHRVMLQTALWINLIKRDEWTHAASQALGRAAHWLFSILDPASGSTPNLGANDGTLIFPLSATAFNDYRPTVQSAARAFLDTQMTSGVWDEMSLWFGLTPVQKTYQPDHYLSDNLRGKNSWGYLRASRFKSRLSHMDQLHFDLWWRGLNIAQDAGTYLYNADVPWDNPLVSTRVHNTVMVDDSDQMTRGGRFLTLDWFPAYSKTNIHLDENVLQQMTAYHKGYRGVRHERTVTVYADERWVVEDKMISPHSHVYRLHWLLRDGEWKVENDDKSIALNLDTEIGAIRLIIHCSLSGSYRFSLVRAGKLIYGQRNVMPYEGWFSPTYGMKVPALSFAVEVASSQNVAFTSEFIFPASLELPSSAARTPPGS